MTKEAYRLKYKNLRANLSEKDVETLSLQLANKALQLSPECSVWELDNYHIFLPISNKKEVNTEYILHVLQGKDKSIIVPKAHIETGEMTHILLQDNTSFNVSNYGVPEPNSGIEISPKQLDIVFVPLLAFDIKGNRLGYGKGFYDRFLKRCKPEAIFIGLSFFEAEKAIPFEETDIPMHFCVTPTKIYAF